MSVNYNPSVINKKIKKKKHPSEIPAEGAPPLRELSPGVPRPQNFLTFRWKSRVRAPAAEQLLHRPPLPPASPSPAPVTSGQLLLQLLPHHRRRQVDGERQRRLLRVLDDDGGVTHRLDDFVFVLGDGLPQKGTSPRSAGASPGSRRFHVSFSHPKTTFRSEISAVGTGFAW